MLNAEFRISVSVARPLGRARFSDKGQVTRGERQWTNLESGIWNPKLCNSATLQLTTIHFIHIFHSSRIAVHFRLKAEENGQREEVSGEQ